MPGLGIRNRTIQSFSVEAVLSSIWVLSTGFWVDSSTWIDTAVWQDGAVASLNFSALPSLPVERRTAVTTAANTTATALAVTPQSVIDLVSTSKDFWDLFSTYTDSPPTVFANTTEAIRTWRGWKGNNFLEPDLTERPVKASDASVNFADVNDEMLCSTVTSTTDVGLTVFMVCQAPSATGIFCLVSNYNTVAPVQGWLLRVNNGNASFEGRPTSAADSYRTLTAALPSPTAKVLIEASAAPATGALTVRVNGGTVTSLTAATSANLLGSVSGTRLNDIDANSNAHTGKQFGIAVFPTTLSAANANIVRNFMTNLYGVV